MIIDPLLLRTRRHFFKDCGIGLGKIALASMLAKESFGAMGNPGFMRFPVKAKRVIFLFMAGAPSQLELFDHKPKLKEIEGKPIPPSVIKGQRYAFIQPDAAVLGPCFPFSKHGESGAEISDRLPYLSKIADDLTFVKSMHTDHSSARTADPSEIGALAVWLCAPIAHNVTGTSIPIDGGWTAQ